MPLTKVQIRPGFNKQATESEAMGQWVDGDNVRFRYGQPEKTGGWESLVTGSQSKLVGAARAMHVWSDLNGNKYAALGTNKVLAVYFEGAFYDITPIETDNAVTGNITTTSGSKIVLITCSVPHNLEVGELLTFKSSGSFSGTSMNAATFDNVVFEILTAPSTTTFTIQVAIAEAGSAVTNNGTVTTQPYEPVGPLYQTYGYGFGTNTYGGTTSTAPANTLNGLLQNDSAGTGGSGTSITLTSTSGFPASGTILVGAELITYSGVSTNDLTGITRGTNGTATAAHTSGAVVTSGNTFVGWGSASNSSSVVLEPANWSLDNFGQILIATIKNGRSFTWDPSSTNSLQTRATIGTGMPTRSVMTIVSDRDRHLLHLGTETTIGTPGSQDKMFIRFSDQENLSDYTPTSVNTAGTFQLDDGTKIVGAIKGKDYILVATDTATYLIQFVGPPFTFSIRKVASNAGMMGQHALCYANGAVFWMGKTGGFYMFDGTVKNLPCLVEDFVFTNNGAGDLGINFDSGELVYAGINELYSEINWFYPSAGSEKVDRCVTYNFAENVWTTSSLNRSSWIGSTVYENPFGTEYNDSSIPTFPVVNGVTAGCSILYQHEVGNNQVNTDSTETAIGCFITSGEFDLTVDGEGEYFMSIKRFLPDFKVIDGDAQITIFINEFPQGTSTSSPLGPFTITSSTNKIDTRARGRLAAVKIASDGLNESWRYGQFRFDVQPDGRR